MASGAEARVINAVNQGEAHATTILRRSAGVILYPIRVIPDALALKRLVAEKKVKTGKTNQRRTYYVSDGEN